jgi:predicted RNA-binding Zn-ribbon protein involved in translation (DUF1610 family)
MTKPSKKKESCNHRKAWVIIGGLAFWCPECGAWRLARTIKDNLLEFHPKMKRWQKTGRAFNA